MNRAEALALPLSALAGRKLSVHCAGCRLVTELRAEHVAPFAGPGLTLGGVVARLRCRRCRAAPAWVELAEVMPGKPADMVPRVTLVGIDARRPAQ